MARDKNTEYVDIIASGYEWVCPVCEKMNNTIEVTETVTCKCGQVFYTNTPEHAIG